MKGCRVEGVGGDSGLYWINEGCHPNLQYAVHPQSQVVTCAAPL